MKRAAGKSVGIALTWDGARAPASVLNARAKTFLKQAGKVPAPRQLTKLFANDEVREIRICWVPQLRGGEAGLSGSFPAPEGLRLAFRAMRTVPFGDVLGVVYRRSNR